MTRQVQIRHVLTKDLREHRMLVALYLLLLAALTGIAVWLGDLSRPPAIEIGVIPMVALEVVAVLLSAAVIQSDPPARPDAYWASRPLEPSAVLAAKATFVLLVVVLPAVVALLIVGAAYGVAAMAMLSSIGVQIRWYLVVALVAALAASITSELRAFVTAAIGILVGAAVFAFAWPGSEGWRTELRIALSTAGALAALTVLWRIYSTREARTTLRVSTIAVAVLVLAAFRTDDRLDLSRPLAKSSAAAPRLTLQSQLGQSVSYATDVQNFPVAIGVDGAPDDQLLWLRDGTLRIHLVDGSMIDASIGRDRIPLNSRVYPRITGIRWIGDSTAPAPTRGAGISAEVREADWLRIDQGVRRLELRGVIEYTAPFIRASVPMRAGAMAEAPGLRLRILEADPTERSSLVRLRISRLDTDASVGPRFHPLVVSEFAVVSSARAEAISLPNWGSVGGSLRVAGPGARLFASDMRLSAREGGGGVMVVSVGGAGAATSYERSGPPPIRDPAWFADARLLVIGWRSLGYRPIHLVADVDPRERRRRMPGR